MKSILVAALLSLTALATLPSADAAQPPIQCVMAPCGPQCLAIAPCSPTDRLPDLPGLPTFPVCVTDPCPFIVCDRATDQVQDIRYEFTTSCGLILTKTSPACPAGPYVTDHQVGGLVLRHAACAEQEVETPWSCAPPSGGWVERDLWWVELRVLVCDGGLPPIFTT